jgi:hypothetical protein
MNKLMRYRFLRKLRREKEERETMCKYAAEMKCG